MLERSRNISELAAAKLKMGQGIVGRVAETREPIFCEDITKDPRFYRASNVRYTITAFASVPIEVKGKVLGVLNISPQKDEENVEHKNFIKFVTIIANQSAIAFENIGISN